ncbi:glutamate-gated chloride channel-like [Uloborus diversus]|uniref:glutamate-gated chloride channel-like n=1 Tax=Uloborus diversus TaxID=327109 RepID=UPI00240A2729|nr:glutamate-gated chloride channel-like [Uloborus diversus]
MGLSKRLFRYLYYGLEQSKLSSVEQSRFADKSDKEILDALVGPDSQYDKRTRPSSMTKIQVNVLLHSLSSPDESSLNYEVEFLMYRRWEDPRLKYQDDGRHKYLNGMSHVNDVWLPNTYIVKHGSLKEPLVDVSLRVYDNGSVVHIMRRGISINCQGNLKIFPFDNPKCPFAIESVALEEDEMQLVWSTVESPLRTATSLQSFNAYLIYSEIGECGEMFTWRGNYSCLHILLVFTRDKNFYFSTVFVPGIILVASAFISFWLDKGVVPARVMIGVTTMLSFCTTTNNFRSSLPVVSNLTAMNLWDGVCMFFIYSSLLEFVIVNYLYRKPLYETQDSTPFLCSRCKKLSRSQVGDEASNELRQKEKDDEAGEKSTEKSRFAWIRVSAADRMTKMTSKELSFKIESLAKILFPSSFSIFVLVYFIVFAAILPQGHDNWAIQSVSIDALNVLTGIPPLHIHLKYTAITFKTKRLRINSVLNDHTIQADDYELTSRNQHNYNSNLHQFILPLTITESNDDSTINVYTDGSKTDADMKYSKKYCSRDCHLQVWKVHETGDKNLSKHSEVSTIPLPSYSPVFTS